VEVYLRVRGGTCYRRPFNRASRGLSPRTRRNRCRANRRARTKGSISAYAEEPCSRSAYMKTHRVYLRVRGGTGLDTRAPHCYWGLSPRTRRNHRVAPKIHRRKGLSPRTRRNLFKRRKLIEPRGSISAYAEEPLDHNLMIQNRKRRFPSSKSSQNPSVASSSNHTPCNIKPHLRLRHAPITTRRLLHLHLRSIRRRRHCHEPRVRPHHQLCRSLIAGRLRRWNHPLQAARNIRCRSRRCHMNHRLRRAQLRAARRATCGKRKNKRNHHHPMQSHKPPPSQIRAH
jgi:hypothetical protein